jgi:hypothetical protein
MAVPASGGTTMTRQPERTLAEQNKIADMYDQMRRGEGGAEIEKTPLVKRDICERLREPYTQEQSRRIESEYDAAAEIDRLRDAINLIVDERTGWMVARSTGNPETEAVYERRLSDAIVAAERLLNEAMP